jgi:hypothetical protein
MLELLSSAFHIPVVEAFAKDALGKMYRQFVIFRIQPKACTRKHVLEVLLTELHLSSRSTAIYEAPNLPRRVLLTQVKLILKIVLLQEHLKL